MLGMICSKTRNSCNRRSISPRRPGSLISCKNRSIASVPTCPSLRRSIAWRMVLQVRCSMRRLYRLETCISSNTLAGSVCKRDKPERVAHISFSPRRIPFRIGQPRNLDKNPTTLMRDRAIPTKLAELYRTSLVNSKNCCMNSSTGKTPSVPLNCMMAAISTCFDRSNESCARPVPKCNSLRSRNKY